MIVKTQEELEYLRQGGRILKNILKELVKITRPGISAQKINQLTGRLAREQNAIPSFLGHDNFPANLCVSLNEEIVHGLPQNKKINKGDLVSYDLGIKYKGFFTDAAVTIGVGPISPVRQKIIKVCRECLNLGIKQAKSGNRIGDISAAIQNHAEKNNFSVIRRLVGHGVGRAVHEDPSVPNFGIKARGLKLEDGMCLAIEPMIARGSFNITLLNDGWTYSTYDKKISCHFEHTIIVGKKTAEIIT
ncbi:MAG: type I methionyl aminopeptidase [Patescibacteria group bacterium]|nr:type I methionyl aminopeptidase [Patescibacteria group bacterium]